MKNTASPKIKPKETRFVILNMYHSHAFVRVQKLQDVSPPERAPEAISEARKMSIHIIFIPN